MRLLKLLKNKPFCNDTHLLIIPVLLIIIGFKYYFTFLFLLIYLIWIIKRTKYIFPILILSLSFICIISIKNIFKYINQDKLEYMGYVDDVINENNLDLYSNGIIIRCYIYNHEYKPGDIIKVEGVNILSNKSYDTDYSYLDYLESKGISKYIKVSSSSLVCHLFSFKTIKYNYLSYLKKILSSDSYGYIATMVFQSNELDSTLKDSYSILGISHILAISGLHIMFLYSILSFILFKIFKYYKKLIPLVILGIYVFIIGAPSSALRSYLFLLIASLNRGKIKYQRLDILSITALISLLLNPYRLFETGFILSYIVSFILIFSSDFIKTKNSLLNKYLLFILIFLSTLPFTSSISGNISILGLLLSPILSLVIGYIILPLSYVLALVPILDYILKYIFIFINNYVTNLSSMSLLIPIMSFNIYMKIIYYMALIFLYHSFLNKSNLIISLLYYSIYLISILSINYINPLYQITFLDVGQGDSCFIRCPNNKGNMLIDCYNAYDYLKDMAIDRLDYLVITHSDQDHIGDYLEIIDNIEVRTILYPKYDTRASELLSQYSNSIEVDYTYSFYLSNLYIDILGPINSYSECNSCSIVLKFEINGYKFLFTGDATEEEELDIVNMYGEYIDSDILKVGHHGSTTSSSEIFLEKVTPIISIISVGLNNKYNLPNEEVIKRLNKYSSIYLTYKTGNVIISVFSTKIKIHSYY